MKRRSFTGLLAGAAAALGIPLPGRAGPLPPVVDTTGFTRVFHWQAFSTPARGYLRLKPDDTYEFVHVSPWTNKGPNAPCIEVNRDYENAPKQINCYVPDADVDTREDGTIHVKSVERLTHFIEDAEDMDLGGVYLREWSEKSPERPLTIEFLEGYRKRLREEKDLAG